MQSVVNSDVFTDEQKVLIIEAINKKQIVIDFEPTFEQLNNSYSYFIKSGKKYVYVLQFGKGLYFIKINAEYYNQHHAIFNEYTLSENTMPFLTSYNIYYYDKVNLLPYAKYDKLNNIIVVINQSPNAEIFKYLMSRYSFSSEIIKLVEIHSKNNLQLSQPIENLRELSFHNNELKFTYRDNKTDSISLEKKPIETEIPEKNPIDKRVEKLPKSADYKNMIETEQLEKVKTYILDEIEKSIKNKSRTTDLSYDKIPKSIRQQTEQFIKSICKDKDYIFGTTQFGYSLILYLP